jgi:hypothetical protein
VKIKIFARNGSKSRYMGEITLRDETHRAMLNYFARDVPFILNTHLEQRKPVALVARKPDAELPFAPEMLPLYGATVFGAPSDIYQFIKKGAL